MYVIFLYSVKSYGAYVIYVIYMPNQNKVFLSYLITLINYDGLFHSLFWIILKLSVGVERLEPTWCRSVIFFHMSIYSLAQQIVLLLWLALVHPVHNTQVISVKARRHNRLLRTYTSSP